LEKIARLCVKHDLAVLTDEIYSELTYEGAEHVSIAQMPGMRERTVFLHGFSKAVCHDRIPGRLCVRSADFDRGDDEGSSVRDPLRQYDGAGRSDRGSREWRAR
jgi:hypothetical protein